MLIVRIASKASVTALNYGFGLCDCGKHRRDGKKKIEIWQKKGKKNLDHFSIYACHPCAGAMLIFSVSFQFYRMSPEGDMPCCEAVVYKDFKNS